MREIIINFAERIVNSDDFENICYDILEYFKKEHNIVLHINMLEIIWRLKNCDNNNDNLLLEIANLCSVDMGNQTEAYRYHKEYFIRQNSQDDYETTLNKLYCVNKDNDIEPLYVQSELFPVYAKLSCIILFLYYAITNKEIQLVFDLEKYIEIFMNKVEEFLFNNPNTKCNELMQIDDDFKMISSYLSGITHHNDLNKLAIEFNKDNEQAYFNIMEDLLFYKNYDEALKFYNETYILNYNKPHENDVSAVFWEVVEYYAKICNFYKSVYYQKLALEYELGV